MTTGLVSQQKLKTWLAIAAPVLMNRINTQLYPIKSLKYNDLKLEDIFELHKTSYVITTKFFDIHSLTDNLPLLSCILRTCLQNPAYHKLSSLMLYNQKRSLLTYRTHKIMIPTSVHKSIHQMLSVLRLPSKWKKGASAQRINFLLICFQYNC